MSETKTCAQCKQHFTVDDKDREFYQKIEVPEPRSCPDCRFKRRLMERNARTLYYRKCDKTGKQILSQYHEGHPFPVYEYTEWEKDDWDGMTYGQAVDLNRGFFEQFKELENKVPHFSIFAVPNSLENSDFTNCTGYLKNCYLIFESDHDEDCYYSNLLKNSKDIVDSSICYDSEQLYECIDCTNCHRSIYLQDCENCSDSAFLKNCIGCHDCIASTNLKQKSLMINNKQYSKEEYEAKKKELDFSKLSKLKGFEKECDQFFKEQFYKFRNAINVENCSGDHLHNSKNAKLCFDSKDLENCNYCARLSLHVKDSMDYNSWGDKVELAYMCSACGDNSYNIKFCSTCSTNNKNIEYCIQCSSCSDCFGCVGLKKKQYCILNKQYTKEEYTELRQKLIEQMKTAGEYGEYFPKELAPFGYNETIAMDYFPLTKEQALAAGYKWRDPDQKEYQPQTYVVGDDISEVNEDIVNQILSCKVCKRNYKVIPQELVYLKTNKLPIPDLCPNDRHLARMKKRNPANLFARECMCEQAGHDHAGKCLNKFETTYDPNRPEKIYCEECYQKSVI